MYELEPYNEIVFELTQTQTNFEGPGAVNPFQVF